MQRQNLSQHERIAGGNCCGSPHCPTNHPGEGTCKSPQVPCMDKVVPMDADFPCSFRNCVIFGGHDVPYYPPFDPKKCARRGRRGKFDDTLGFPVGVVAGAVPTKSNIPHVEAIRFAGNLKGFAASYFTHRNEWNPELIDNIVVEGQVLFGDSDNMDEPNKKVMPEVYDDNEQRIMRHFKINDHEFMIELEAPFEMYGTPSYTSIIANLRPIMRAFFRKTKYGVFWTPNWYLLIWRDNGIWMVLDLNGRDKDTLKSNHDGGFPMLLVLKGLDNVVHLIQSESNLAPGDKFTLREILVIRLVKPTGESQERGHGMRMSEFEVIASDYAYLKSNLHLTLNPNDALRNRSALPVAVATAVASKIDHPATWDAKTYDKVICYGVNMCKNCWEPCIDINQPMDLDTFPRQIRMGQFVAEVLLTPNVYEGWWKCVPMYKYNDFHLMLEKALDQNDYVIFQINNQMYSLWKKADFIYLMDPYRHNIVGRILEEGEDPKSASVRMFGNMDRMLSVFHQILLESNRSAIFHIHTLKIRNITECPPGTAPALLPPNEDIDVRSLNENINFDENYDKCLEELGAISDYEEDLASDIEPIEEVSSSEEMVEEEEGGEAGPDEGGEDEEDED